MESSQKKEFTIFIGNPGVGKSALLNCILGNNVFESGLCVGTGLTSVCQIAFNQRDGIFYGDTPGLYDIKKLEEAAEEISKALKSGDGNYRIVFAHIRWTSGKTSRFSHDETSARIYTS